MRKAKASSKLPPAFAEELVPSESEIKALAIKARGGTSAKHNTVQDKLQQLASKKPKKPTIKVRPLEKHAQASKSTAESEYEKFLEQLADRDRHHHQLLKQAELIRTRLEQLSDREKTKISEALRDCYGIYEFIENSPEPWTFYEQLRSYFKVKMERIQSNTPDEALLVRFIFSRKTTKQISEYATVIRYARETHIAKKDFVRWYTETTQTRILAAARKSGTTDYKERLARARILLLRYFDLREQWPLGTFEYPMQLAEKQMHLPGDLIFVICRGINKFNRDVIFDPKGSVATRVPMAQISALHFIPNNIDLANDIIDRMARMIAPEVERFEREVDEHQEKVWANDLTNHLTERELGSSYKSADRWADRMQAAIAEDQISFVNQRKKIQKLRNKARR